MRELRKSSGEMQPQRLGKDYVLYYGGSFAIAVGLWVQRLTIAWIAWEITGSGFWLGLIATADFLPSILLGPPAGILADRYNRKRLTLLCQVSNVAIVLALASIVSSGLADRYWLLIFALLNGVVASVQQPVRMSLTATLVDKALIAKAVTLMSIAIHAARFAGPVLVGPILAFGEPTYAFLCCAVFYSVMIVALPFIRVGDRSRPLSEWKGLKQEFSIGLKFTAMHPTVGPVIWSFLLLSIFGRSIFELLPGLADGVFQEGANGFSWLAGAVGTSTILSCLWLAQRPDIRCTYANVIRNILIFGITAVALGLAPNFWFAVALALVAAFAVTTSTIASAAVVQTSVPDDIRGRVLGIYGALYRAAPAVGAIGMGWASDYVGLRWPIVVGAVICLIWWLGMQFAAPRRAALEETENN